ncbi:uncharacterized protein SPPG_03830 [Spizellomyces punctatus DAOM BR117]|uniref:Intraflagellar transport protein 46 homolog n=1 Tax=Spizellomyces punctatus (strain DAOM BR117) TaxID=645134 RepID=A0A0L0HHZ0_SPIPD|nr:uncharacterized protein SPPG_03830 [Spizellomyces punctatus DAOM BR117]KND00712.1 hypothetical protein SPPG_03830 [Spizellomyces punctatus DAOM BR117]|eukprot:XP_016608751.1 hypothetical protein SPPG_03830 [Spizellomyces punctatus DAOM BR117]
MSGLQDDLDYALHTTKVTNNYYDEILELTGRELEEFPTPIDRTEENDSVQSRSMEGHNERGDSPPSANLTESDEEYDEDEEEDEEDIPASGISSHPGRPSAAPAGRTGLGRQKQDLDGVTVGGTNGLLDDDDEDYDENDDDFSTGGHGGFSTKSRTSSFGGGGTSYKELSVNDELQELFQYIQRYKPQEQELETELKSFIPDYVPAIGDIDAFIKIPRPDGNPDQLGLLSLDEPNTEQSDPTVLDLHLRAITKSTAPIPTTVRSIDPINLKTNPKLIDAWIKNTRDLHAHKPPQTVHYTKRMPDIEELMQVWPSQVEEGLAKVNLPTADIDLPLSQFAAFLSLILDIPISSPSQPSSKNQSSYPSQKGAAPTHVVEALHVMFTLYSEFKNSAHFKAMERSAPS